MVKFLLIIMMSATTMPLPTTCMMTPPARLKIPSWWIIIVSRICCLMKPMSKSEPEAMSYLACLEATTGETMFSSRLSSPCHHMLILEPQSPLLGPSFQLWSCHAAWAWLWPWTLVWWLSCSLFFGRKQALCQRRANSRSSGEWLAKVRQPDPEEEVVENGWLLKVHCTGMGTSKLWTTGVRPLKVGEDGKMMGTMLLGLGKIYRQQSSERGECHPWQQRFLEETAFVTSFTRHVDFWHLEWWNWH